jgi:hypothetical protein
MRAFQLLAVLAPALLAGCSGCEETKASDKPEIPRPNTLTTPVTASGQAGSSASGSPLIDNPGVPNLHLKRGPR